VLHDEFQDGDIEVEYLETEASAADATAAADTIAAANTIASADAAADATDDVTAATLILNTKTDLINLFATHNPALLTLYKSTKTLTNFQRVQVSKFIIDHLLSKPSRT